MSRLYIFSIAAALLATAVIAIVFTSTARLSDCRDFSEATLTAGDSTFRIAVADSHIERTQGLSGCRQLPPDSGMYFVYDEPVTPQFWMKDMFVPLDIIWIAEGRILGIEANVPPPATPEIQDLPRYRPPAAITGVLELPAGAAASHNLTPGTPVTLVR